MSNTASSAPTSASTLRAGQQVRPCALSYTEFETLVFELHQRAQAEAKYLASMPRQLSELVSTNELAESQYAQISILCESVFAQHWEDVQWFLHDWKPGFSIEVGGEQGRPGVRYTIHSLADYLAYARAELFRQSAGEAGEASKQSAHTAQTGDEPQFIQCPECSSPLPYSTKVNTHVDNPTPGGTEEAECFKCSAEIELSIDEAGQRMARVTSYSK